MIADMLRKSVKPSAGGGSTDFTNFESGANGWTLFVAPGGDSANPDSVSRLDTAASHSATHAAYGGLYTSFYDEDGVYYYDSLKMKKTTSSNITVGTITFWIYSPGGLSAGLIQVYVGGTGNEDGTYLYPVYTGFWASWTLVTCTNTVSGSNQIEILVNPDGWQEHSGVDPAAQIFIDDISIPVM